MMEDAEDLDFPACFGSFPVMTRWFFRDGLAYLSNKHGGAMIINAHYFRRILAEGRAKETTLRKRKRYIRRR